MTQLNRLIINAIEPVITDHDAENPSSIIFIHSSWDSFWAIDWKSTCLRMNS